MSNIVPFPPLTSAPQSSGHHLAARFLERPPACSHAVQFYDDHDFLVETVAQFIRHGLDAGHSVLAIATPDHTDGIIERLGKTRVASALVEKRLVLADADALLARFMVGGEVSVAAFASALDLVVSDLPAVAQGGPFRAFGEMVDRLWQQGHAAAALQLEEMWCKLCDERNIALLCGYAMSNFYKQTESPRFREVCRLHSHVIPTEKFALSCGSDFDRLREISLLEQRERLLRGEVFYREQLERALRELSQRNTAPERARVASSIEELERAASALSTTAHDLIEPSVEIAAIARALELRYPDRAASDDIARLNAAILRLQHAAARAQRQGDGAGPEAAACGLNASAAPR